MWNPVANLFGPGGKLALDSGGWVHLEAGLIFSDSGLHVFASRSTPEQSPPPTVAGCNADAGVCFQYSDDPSQLQGTGGQIDVDVSWADIVLQTNQQGELHSGGVAFTAGPGYGISATETQTVRAPLLFWKSFPGLVPSESD